MCSAFGTNRWRWALLLELAALVLLAPASAQQQGKLLVDFRALNADGQPVLDLKPEDLILRVDGRERPVSSLDVIRRNDAETTSVLAPPFATNSAAQSGPRNVIVFIDEASIAPGREHLFRDALSSFLTQLSPRDRVRLMSLRPIGPTLPFEEGVRDIPAALARFVGHSTPSETANDLICRSGPSLRRIGAELTNYTGSPVPTVVIVSAGFGSPPAGGVSSFGNYGKCPVLENLDFENVGNAARAINAAVYVILPTDATASLLPRITLERGVETLAGALGAEMIRGRPPTAATMARIAIDTSSYYLATFETLPGDRPDVPHRIELRSRRPNITVRARPEIAGPSRKPAGGPTVPKPDAMIRVATTYRDLPLRAAGFASRADDGKVRLVVLFEPEDPAVKITAASIGLYDASGKLTRWTAESSELASRPLLAGIIVPPGTYRMRVAASSGTAAGAVDTEVRAELSEAAGMTTSALLVGVEGPNGFVPRMQFSAADKGAFGYLEIYAVRKNAVLTVSFALASTAEGPALAGDDVQLTPGPRDDTRIAFSGFAIDGMPPGDLVMRAIVSVDGKPVSRAYQTIRKSK